MRYFSLANNIAQLHQFYSGLKAVGLPRKKPERIVGYYNPETDKPQGRNEPCKCGSGQKFKKCCIGKPKDNQL